MMFLKKKSKAVSKDKESLDLVKTLVNGVFDNELDVSKLTPNATFEELGFDSIKFINLMLSLEDIIDTDLEVIAADIDVASIHTIEDIMLLVEKYKKR